MKNYQGVILVTGGARGIGAATCLLAAEHDYDVCINYRSSGDAAEEIVSAIKERGRNAIAIKADVTDPVQVDNMFRVIDEKMGRISALVNNAGVSIGRRKIIDMSAEEFDEIVGGNLNGCVLCTREAIKRMGTTFGGAGGSIVNVSSQSALFGGNQISPYATAKGGVISFSKGIAREVATEDIRVNVVSPGVIDTEMNKLMSQEQKQSIRKSIPLGRLGTPDDVAPVILWLLSDAASYITGSVVPVSGGR